MTGRTRQPTHESNEHSFTISVDDASDSVDATGDAARLIVACEGQHPTVPALRIDLSRLDELVIGRGGARLLSRIGSRATLTLPDGQASRRQAQLTHLPDGWELTDLDSKNGTLLDGEPVTRTVLADGDVIEIGSTMLVFREGDETGDLELAIADGPTAFLTVDPELARRFAQLARIVPSKVPVLIRGETGTGKEVVARAIHEGSRRRGAMVAVNCGALPDALIESELFGHRRGAFSGAREDREGLVRRADGGTLFLDEIAELPLESQAVLLRVVQEQEVRPVGCEEVTRVDVRFVAATHQDLAARVADGRFRQDLYARLAGFEIELPPLRQRREDLGTLIAAILPRITERPDAVRVHRLVVRALLRYRFPGNVRELEQMLRAAVALADGEELRLGHLPDPVRGCAAAELPRMRPEDRALRLRLIEILRQHRGNVMAAGRAMGKAPVQIRRWCRRFGIDVESFRSPD